MQDKMEKNYSIKEQQVDKLHDGTWKFDEPIKNLEILLGKSSAEEEIELIEATKEKIRGL